MSTLLLLPNSAKYSRPAIVPKLSGEPILFDDPEVLDFPWDLSNYDAVPTTHDIRELDAGLGMCREEQALSMSRTKLEESSLDSCLVATRLRFSLRPGELG